MVSSTSQELESQNSSLKLISCGGFTTIGSQKIEVVPISQKLGLSLVTVKDQLTPKASVNFNLT